MCEITLTRKPYCLPGYLGRWTLVVALCDETSMADTLLWHVRKRWLDEWSDIRPGDVMFFRPPRETEEDAL